MAEFGPALALFFMGFFFPAVNLTAMTASYEAAWYLNAIQLERASQVDVSDLSSKQAEISQALVQQWQQSGIGIFAGLDSQPVTNLSSEQVPGSSGSVRQAYVRVETKFSIRPFLAVPFPASVPGLNTAYAVTVSSRRLVEDISTK